MNPRIATIGSYPVFPSQTRIRLHESQKESKKEDFTYDPYLPTIEASVNDFISAGIEILTTGQTREMFKLLFLDPGQIDNIQREGSAVNVLGKITRKSPIRVSDLKYAREVAKRRGSCIFKEPITDPYTLATYTTVVKGYTSIKELTLDFLRKIVIPEALAMQPFLDMFQFDAPQYSAVSSLPDYIPEIYEELASALDKPIILHVCGDTAPIFEMLKKLKVDVLSLDFRINPKLADEVARHSFNQTIGLGIVDVDPTTFVSESVSDILLVMKRLIGKIGEDRISLIHPACGQRNLTRAIAFKKNLNMVLARNQFFYGDVETVPASSEPFVEKEVIFDQRFSIYVNYDSRQIILSTVKVSSDGLRRPIFCISGVSCKKIIHTVLDRKVLGEAPDINLLAELSYELAKAETALKSRGAMIYRQSQHLLFPGPIR